VLRFGSSWPVTCLGYLVVVVHVSFVGLVTGVLFVDSERVVEGFDLHFLTSVVFIAA